MLQSTLKSSAFGLLFSAFCLPVLAQNPISEILKQVEQNNLLLQSTSYAVKAQKAALAAENNLPDPEVEYVHQWGSPAGVGKETELTVTQGFDFPTTYMQRNRYKHLQGKALDRDVDQILQDVKLQAAQLCVEMIGLNRSSVLLQQVADNLQKYASRMEQALADGNATVLEVNKVKMSLMEITVELENNHAAYHEALQHLVALNGGQALEFAESEYPELPVVLRDMNTLMDDFRQHDASLLRMSDEVTASGQLVKVKQAEGLPKMHVGYQRNTATGESLNGVVGGISIPLFSNRGKVKSAKAEQTSRTLQLQDLQFQMQSEVMALFNNKEKMGRALESYDRNLMDNQLSLLAKALDLGEFTIMDFLTEVNQVLAVRREFLTVEQEYQQICYQLLRYRL